MFLDESVSIDIRLVDFGNSIRSTSEEISLYEEDFELQTLLYRAPEVCIKFSRNVINPADIIIIFDCLICAMFSFA